VGAAAAPHSARALGPPRPVTGEPTTAPVLDLAASELAPDRHVFDLEHPVTAYLNGLAPSSRRPQLSALDWNARRATQLYTAETMPWHRLRRPHVPRIRGLLEEDYLPATANRMLPRAARDTEDAPMSCQGALRSREAGRLGEQRTA
jgi:hypothetical protein